MIEFASVAESLARFLGAHTVPRRDAHERARALQRACICAVIAGIWISQLFSGRSAGPWGAVFPCFLAVLSVTSLAFWVYLSRHPNSGISAQYVFLLLDPPVAIGILVYDPATFAFLNPLVLAIIVRCGIRFGLRTFWLAWMLTVASALALLPTSSYWQNELEITLSFGLMLALIPLLFVSLLRNIHSVRALEEERARLAAVHDVMVARSSFLAKVSHEIRSPLQSIISALDVYELRQEEADPSQAEFIARIRRSSIQLNTQVRDLLTLAKGEAGRLDIRPESFDAVGLVHTLADVLRERARARRLTLVVDAPPQPLFVVADGARIDQVLTNLVINSIGYTDTGQVRLSLRPYERAITRTLRFKVSDTGPGDTRRHVADAAGARPRPDRRRAQRGRIGDRLGDRAHTRRSPRRPGRGRERSSAGARRSRSTIPAEPMPRRQGAQRTSSTAPAACSSSTTATTCSMPLASVVEELGFECDRASSAAVGANLLAARVYDVALIDIEMPLKGGVALGA